MNILIAGGAGFIGSHLIDRFLKDGHEVICVDNFVSGSRDNIAHLANNPHFSLIEQDICQPFAVSGKLDVILHFASPASPNPSSPVSYMAHPVETLMVNSLGSKNLLDLALANDCQIVFASTSEVYGDPTVHPQPETYWGNVNSIGVRSCYDEAKRFMEAIAFAYHRTKQAKIKVMRIFNTYGPRMRLDDGRFTIGLIRAVMKNEPFTLFGDGSATRSFCYIDDLVEAVTRIVATEAMIGQVVNVGNPGEFRLIDAIHLVEKISGTPLVLDQQPLPPDDPHMRRPDITKAKALLGWEPTVDFETGMRQTLAYYQQQSDLSNLKPTT
jgi:dTDP-glucose 4,6-dehydratase